MNKTRFIVVALLIVALGGPASAGAAKSFNPDRIDLKADVAKMGMEEVRLQQGALMAKRCYFFQDELLRATYHDYQLKKCGEEFYFQEDPAKPFDESKLSAAEKEFMAKLKKREAELKAAQLVEKDGAAKYDARAIANRSFFEQLEPEAFDRLAQTGFVVVPGQHLQLFHVYEENDYRLIPSFITADSVLQLYHLYFDFSLRQIEEQKLLPAAAKLAAGMADKLLARHRAEKDEQVKDGLKRAALYFMIAEDLAGMTAGPEGPGPDESIEERNVKPKPPELVSADDLKRPAPSRLDPAWVKDFMLQRDLILKAEDKRKGPIMGTVDYTMFKPRGHYTRSKALAAYFRTMMWFGQPGFVLDEKEMPLETTLAVVHVLTHDPELTRLHELIYEPTSFYVGPTDDITPQLAREVADAVCGKDSGLDAWIAKKDRIKAELIKRDPARIKPIIRKDERAMPQVRFMGMRYVPDTEIMQRLIDPEVKLRPFPAGLDLFAAMGVPAAIDVLKASEIKWPGYWPEMEKLQKQFADFKPESGEQNLYWRWLRALKTLNQPAPKTAPAFMRTESWRVKDLATALGSWAELRHDTILYSKPVVAECGSSEETPPQRLGYVEARPDFFGELLELQRFTTAELTRRKLLTERLTEVGGQIEEMLVFLERVSKKEVDGQALTAEELDDIRLFGSRLEYLSAAVLVGEPGANWSDVTGPDAFMAVVADVFSNTLQGQVLEEGVGHADELYVLIEQYGYLYIMRGAVFSYYEFAQPINNRLTDEEWQKMLKEGTAPARPGWVNKFFQRQRAAKPGDPNLYSSGC